MKRLHVHLNVKDLDRAVRFYRTLFGVDPSKLEDGYAQWMLDAPAVNFAVSTKECCAGGVSHLGFQVDDAASLAEITRTLSDAGQSVFQEAETTCCYAKGNKTWTADPDGVMWEAFHRLDDAGTMGRDAARAAAIDALREEAAE